MEIRIRIWCQWARPFSVSPQKCFALVFKPQLRNGIQPANSAGEMGSRLLLLLMCKLNLLLFPSQSLWSGPVTLNSGEWGNYVQFGKQHLKSQPSFHRDLIKLGPCQFKQKSLHPCLTRPNQFSLMSFAIVISAFLSTRMNGAWDAHKALHSETGFLREFTQQLASQQSQISNQELCRKMQGISPCK